MALKIITKRIDLISRSSKRWLLIFLIKAPGCLFAQIPSIASFTPTSGPLGTTVVISGTNFSLTPTDNLVMFGTTPTTVTSATATQLTVTVPVGAAAYQPISVTLPNSLSALSAKPFIVTFLTNRLITSSYFRNVATVFPPSLANNLVVVDLDLDGKKDLTNVSSFFNSISVFRRTSENPSWDFDSGTSFSSASGPRELATADLNGDGKPDLITSETNSNTLSIWQNSSTQGTVSFSRTANSVNSPAGVGLGDLNGDGRLDITIGSFGQITLGTNQGSSFSFASLSVSSGGKVAVGDLDGDGWRDLVICQPISGLDITVFRNLKSMSLLSSSSFAGAGTFTTGTGSFMPVIADIDMDGKDDVITANTGGNISVLRNTSTAGNISFATKVDFTTAGNCSGIAVGDLDGDGRPEVVATNNASNSVSVFRNISTAGTIDANSFAPRAILASGDLNVPNSVAIADMNDDAKPEIIVSNLGNGKMMIMENVIPLPPPIINSIVPLSGPPGTTVVITGQYFDPIPSNVPIIVTFNGVTATVTNATSTQLTTIVPPFATTGTVTISISGQITPSPLPFVVAPAINAFLPSSGIPATTVVITGANFSSTPSENIVRFNGVAANITAATTTQLTVSVPATSLTGTITVTTNAMTATSANVFTVGPTITSFDPSGGPPGTQVVITGLNFSPNPSNNTVKFNTGNATVTASTATAITTTVPASATSGRITVRSNNIDGVSAINFTVNVTVGLGNDKFDGLVLYPNPVKEKLIVGAGLLAGVNFRACVFDAVGGQVEERNGVGGEELEFDTSHYPLALYLITITQQGETVTRKFVKK